MTKFLELSKAFVNDDSGQDLIEYALVAGIIGLGTVSAMESLASYIATGLIAVGDALTSATT